MKTATLLLFISTVLAYLFLLHNKKIGPYVKTLPAAILTIYALLNANWIFALIFFLAGVGDFLLTRSHWFYRGVAAFTVAYSILNLVTFTCFSPLYLLALVPFFTIFFCLKGELLREKVFYPFLAYGIIVISPLVVNGTGHLVHGELPLLGFGLLTLAVSDIFIAVRVARPFKALSYIIMITYYAGLVLVSGLL